MKDFLRPAQKEIRALAPAITGINRRIFEKPELNFEEQFAAAHLCAALEAEGFKVRRGTGKLKTAFEAAWRGGRKGPTIAVLAEYDALPNIGHACGHSMIAAAAFGAATVLYVAVAFSINRIMAWVERATAVPGYMGGGK